MTAQGMVEAPRATREEAEAAVRTLIRWAGDDPNREGLVGTPQRLVSAYEEFFAGYREDCSALLGTTFEEVGGYDDLVILKHVRFDSHCEHHIVPILGVAHIGYLPRTRVVGISKLARVVDVYARRLQSQESLTTQIAATIDAALAPRAVGVVIEATHQCMITRGIRKPGISLRTTQFTGQLKTDASLRREFLESISNDGMARAG